VLASAPRSSGHRQRTLEPAVHSGTTRHLPGFPESGFVFVSHALGIGRRLIVFISLSPMQHRPEATAMQRAYARWARIYDAIYDQLLRPGQQAAIAAAMSCGPRVLEVGVGTGLSLEHYPADAEVTGIDLSPDMLARAQEKVRRNRLGHVKSLRVMDASYLDFADASFDAGLALYVITLVPDPEQALTELARVVRPGGEIIIASHLGAEKGPVARIEAVLAPAAGSVGWSSDFKLSRLQNWARDTGLATFAEVRPMPPAGFFKVARFMRTDVAVQSDNRLAAAE
jgi:phosphatidylethanolamine/phosphatidyl-N-methylethanolamine N-methyltransferase